MVRPEIISLIDEIRNDRVHGASQLARQAANVLRQTAESSRADTVDQFLLEQREVGKRLMLARPAMAPVFNIIARLLKAISDKSAAMGLPSIRRFTISEADALTQESLQAVAQIARYGSELTAGNDKVLTHSYSSTVMAVLKGAFTKHRNIEVITTRSGPGHTGERIAQELGHCGIPVTFIDDTAIGLYITTVDKVMVGADRICTDGEVVNGIGTYPLALAARTAGIPFYVFCETLKFDHKLKGGGIDLEEKETSEVVQPERLPAEVKVQNPYFDITPLELVTGIVTENGLLEPQEVIDYLAKHSKAG
jgi:eIF-2B alpha/beta/delta-like uncharacterized protein